MAKKKKKRHEAESQQIEFDDIVILEPDQDDEEKKKKKNKIRYITSTQNFLPIRDIRDGIIITTDSRFIKLMEFSPINFDLRSDDEKASIISQFASVLRTMPKNIQFKVVTKKADTSKFVNRVEQDMEAEENPNCRSLQAQQIQLIKSVGEASGLTRHFYLAFEYEGVLNTKKKNSFARIVGELNRQAATIRAGLRMCGNEQVSLDNNDDWTMEALYTILSRAEADEHTYTERSLEVFAGYANLQNNDPNQPINIPINDFFAPRYIDPGNSPKHIIIDDLYYTFAYIQPNTYPVRAAGGWPQILMNLGEGVDIDIWLKKEEAATIRGKLQRKLRFNKVKMKETEDTSTDYDDLASSIDAGYYLKSGLSSGDDFCYFGTMLTITAHSISELNERYTDIRDYCIRQDLEIKQCSFQMLEALKMSIPICNAGLDSVGGFFSGNSLFDKMKRNILLSQFSSAYPFTSFEMADDDGILLGTSYQNGSLVFVNTFDTHKYNNANMTILGPSGTGKTYTLLCMALRMREKRDMQVFLIAPEKGHEFQRSCEAIGGQFIRIAPGSGQNINIMEIRKKDDTADMAINGEGSSHDSILSQKIQQLHIFFSLVLPDITYEETQYLDEALMMTYERFGITTKNESLNDPNDPTKYRRMPILEDLHNSLHELGEKAERMYSVLTRYVSGSASSFNAQTNVNLDNRFVVIDLTPLTAEMKPLGMFIALDYVWDKAREDITQKKSIFIDETWTLIGPSSSKIAAEFVLKIFKLIRGYGGAAIAATQDVNDFLALDGGRFGTGIINNSRIKLLLRPEPKEAGTLTEIFDLTESEIEMAKMMDKGTGLLVANSNHIFINIKASSREHDLITTDRKDLLRIKEENLGRAESQEV